MISNDQSLHRTTKGGHNLSSSVGFNPTIDSKNVPQNIYQGSPIYSARILSLIQPYKCSPTFSPAGLPSVTSLWTSYTPEYLGYPPTGNATSVLTTPTFRPGNSFLLFSVPSARVIRQCKLSLSHGNTFSFPRPPSIPFLNSFSKAAVSGT
jgi:hypothetical protein